MKFCRTFQKCRVFEYRECCVNAGIGLSLRKAFMFICAFHILHTFFLFFVFVFFCCCGRPFFAFRTTLSVVIIYQFSRRRHRDISANHYSYTREIHTHIHTFTVHFCAASVACIHIENMVSTSFYRILFK